MFGWPTAGLGTSLHRWAVTACGGTTIGDRASPDTARILAGTGFDLMTDADLRRAARADLDRRTAGETYAAVLPADRTGPIGVPDWLRKTGLDEVTSFNPDGSRGSKASGHRVMPVRGMDLDRRSKAP